VGWVENVAAVGAPGLHFHDLRHTGNTFAAMSGASLRDLMTRMGHDSMRAALIYQHKTQGADRKIAERLEALIQTDRQAAREPVQPSSSSHADRTWIAQKPETPKARAGECASGLGLRGGAGDGNRTRMTSLEGWSSAIELHPRSANRQRPRRRECIGWRCRLRRSALVRRRPGGSACRGTNDERQRGVRQG
jgi:hypothetical protein